jgi:hypothetical protein
MFVIAGLDPARFDPYFRLDDAALEAAGGRRVVADGPGYPCRVSLTEAAPGEELVLLEYRHHDVASPYRASGPIYVRRASQAAARHVGEVPDALRRRLLSVRAYDHAGDLREAEVVSGDHLGDLLIRWFRRADIAVVHLHNARPGCFVARVVREP